MEWDAVFAGVQAIAALGIGASLFATRETRRLRRLKAYTEVHAGMPDGPGKLRIEEVLNEYAVSKWSAADAESAPAHAPGTGPRRGLARSQSRWRPVVGVVLLAGAGISLGVLVSLAADWLPLDVVVPLSTAGAVAIAAGTASASLLEAAERRAALTIAEALRRGFELDDS